MMREGRAWSSTTSFAAESLARRQRAVATRTSSDLVELRCVLRHDLVANRLMERSGRGDASDADAGVAAAMSETFEPWPTATEIDTGPPRAVIAARVAKLIGPERG